MPIVQVELNDSCRLREIADLLASRERIVTIAGAGISTNAGIPDFRSKDGLYAVKGGSLFHVSALSDPARWSKFVGAVTMIRQKSKEARPTLTHEFIRRLRQSERSIRAYTQSIDGLDQQSGLSTDLDNGPGAIRYRRLAARRNRMKRRCGVKQSHGKGGVECAPLHGSLQDLRCTACGFTCTWEDDNDIGANCPRCDETSLKRMSRGKRKSAVGQLRPNIVLFDEYDPRSDQIAQIAQHDLSLEPDLLLLFGTELATDGVKALVRDFAKAVHASGGSVILVNRTPPRSGWTGIIDYWISGDCDKWVEDLKLRRPDLWETFPNA